ncbi:MAG: hypothetical protein K6C95_11100 [Lachnospiraceae bacterium]|nr:hypothetical protein [Lachnospiraceae bacterium]
MKYRIIAIASALILALSEQSQVLCVRAAGAEAGYLSSSESLTETINVENTGLLETNSADSSALGEDYPDDNAVITVSDGDEIFAAAEEINPAYVDVESPADISLSIIPEEELVIRKLEEAERSEDQTAQLTDPDSSQSYSIFGATDDAYTFDEGEVQRCTTYQETAVIIVSAFQSRAEEIVVPVNIRTGAELEESYRQIESDDTTTDKEKWNQKYTLFYRYVWRNALSHDHAQPAAGDYLAYQYGGYSALYSGSDEAGGGSALFNGTLTFRMYNYKTNEDKAADIRNSRYYTTAEQEAQVNAAIGPALDGIIEEGMTDKQKVGAIYKYICDNVAYDYSSSSDFIRYTAYGALINGKSVCQGFSMLFYRMALMEGIDARVVSGYGKNGGSGGNHAWNCVKLGDVYYLCDATWDSKKTNYTWFLKGEDDFAGHVPNYKNERVVINNKETGARPNWFKEEDYPIDALSWDDDSSMADYFTLAFSGNGAAAGTVPAVRILTRQQTTSQICVNTIIRQYIEACDLTRSGYLFDGWNSAADGSGRDYARGVPVLELPGLDAAVKSPAGEDDLKMTLYAQWAPLWGDITEADHAQFASYEAFMEERAADPVWVAALPTSADRPDMYVYSGKALTWGDAIHVYDVKKRLCEGTDYTVSYSKNTDAGDAEVTLTFVGNNIGTKAVTWKIESVDISSAAVRIEGASLKSDGTAYIQTVANGSAQKPALYLYRGGTLLKEGTDYTVNAGGECRDPGTYKLTITGIGNYRESRTLDLVITPEHVPAPDVKDVEIVNISVNDLRITGLKKKLTFEKGGAKQNALVVCDQDGNRLTEGVDYNLSYRWPLDGDGNIASGAANVMIIGTAAAKGAEHAVDGVLTRYVGSRAVSYTIKPVSLTSVSMRGFVKSFVYDGNEHFQEFSESGVQLYTASGITLEEDVDFEVSYTPAVPVKAGKVTMKITGKGGFTGKFTKRYSIAKRSLSAGDLMVFIPNENDVEDGTEGVFYTKGATKPVPEVWLSGEPGDLELIKGRDFKVSYKKNTKKGGKAYLKVTGKGNFKGSSGWQGFQIIKRDLGDDIFAVTVPVAKYSEKGGSAIVKPVIRDSNGRKLVNGKDYKIEKYWMTEPGTGLMTVVSKKDVIPFDAVVTAEIKAKGTSGYEGSRLVSYRVVCYDIAKAKGTLTPAAFEYTGSAIRPLEVTGTSLELKRSGELLTEGEDYEVICGDNINVGSYTMIIRGKGRFGGEKKISYRITRRRLWT